MEYGVRKVHSSTGAMSTQEKSVEILSMVGHLRHAAEVISLNIDFKYDINNVVRLPSRS